MWCPTFLMYYDLLDTTWKGTYGFGHPKPCFHGWIMDYDARIMDVSLSGHVGVIKMLLILSDIMPIKDAPFFYNAV